MKHLGFTGTRIGMTFEQQSTLSAFLARRRFGAFRHGDCVGADAQAHKLAIAQGLQVYVHPPLSDKARAFCKGPNVVVLRPRDYLPRNRDIVQASDELIAAPKLAREEQRSGTWAAIRYAVSVGKTVTIVWPNGTTEER